MSNNLMIRLEKIEEMISPKDDYALLSDDASIIQDVKNYNNKFDANLNPLSVKKGLKSVHHDGKILYYGKNYNFDAALITYIRQRDKNKSQEKKH